MYFTLYQTILCFINLFLCLFPHCQSSFNRKTDHERGHKINKDYFGVLHVFGR